MRGEASNFARGYRQSHKRSSIAGAHGGTRISSQPGPGSMPPLQDLVSTLPCSQPIRSRTCGPECHWTFWLGNGRHIPMAWKEKGCNRDWPRHGAAVASPRILLRAGPLTSGSNGQMPHRASANCIAGHFSIIARSADQAIGIWPRPGKGRSAWFVPNAGTRLTNQRPSLSTSQTATVTSGTVWPTSRPSFRPPFAEKRPTNSASTSRRQASLSMRYATSAACCSL